MKTLWAKRIIFLFSSFILFTILTTVSATASAAYPMPSKIDTSANYLFFIHNWYVEKYGESGACDYHGIIKSFQDNGFTVISEIRTFHVSPGDYAKKVAKQVRTLLKAGVPPEHITVSGHSKGGYITLHVSTILQNDKINFVVMAGCGIAPLGKVPQSLEGCFLSIYDLSDKVAGSCQSDFAKTSRKVKTKEIVLNTGKGHKLFFQPNKIWLQPIVEWIGLSKK